MSNTTHRLGLVIVLLLSFTQCNQVQDADAANENPYSPPVSQTVTHKNKSTQKIIRFQDEQSGKFGYKNAAGEVVTEPVFDGAMAYLNTNRIRVMQDEKFGFINDVGALMIPVRFAQAQAFTEDYAAVQIDGKWGYIDLNGNIAVEAKYQKAQPFQSGMAAVMQDSKWGYINQTGRLVIPTDYQRTIHFSDGLAPVMLNGKWGYVNKENKQAIPLKYDWAEAFNRVHENMARVAVGSKAFFIDVKGRCVRDCE